MQVIKPNPVRAFLAAPFLAATHVFAWIAAQFLGGPVEVVNMTDMVTFETEEELQEFLESLEEDDDEF